jgi:hypothetical protein
MGSRKGMRAQEGQARAGKELSGAGAGSREPDTRRDPDTGRRSIEEPPEDDSRSTLASTNSDESDDIEEFEDDRDDQIDEENDLA